jgi:hypothetical protein
MRRKKSATGGWRGIFPPQEEVTKNEPAVEKEETQNGVLCEELKHIALHNTILCSASIYSRELFGRLAEAATGVAMASEEKR